MIKVSADVLPGSSIEVRWTSEKTVDFTVRLMRGPTEIGSKRIPAVGSQNIPPVARFDGLERDHRYVVIVEAPDGEQGLVNVTAN